MQARPAAAQHQLPEIAQTHEGRHALFSEQDFSRLALQIQYPEEDSAFRSRRCAPGMRTSSASIRGKNELCRVTASASAAPAQSNDRALACMNEWCPCLFPQQRRAPSPIPARAFPRSREGGPPSPAPRWQQAHRPRPSAPHSVPADPARPPAAGPVPGRGGAGPSSGAGRGEVK